MRLSEHRIMFLPEYYSAEKGNRSFSGFILYSISLNVPAIPPTRLHWRCIKDFRFFVFCLYASRTVSYYFGIILFLPK